MLLNIFQLIKIFENNKNSFLLFCDFFKKYYLNHILEQNHQKRQNFQNFKLLSILAVFYFFKNKIKLKLGYMRLIS
jgi:hypothetical protein